MKFIVYFDDVSGSLQTEQVLKRRGVPCALDAAPRRPGASCGYVIRAEAQSREELASVLGDSRIRWAEILLEESGEGGSCGDCGPYPDNRETETRS